jgi:hypothetical protein
VCGKAFYSLERKGLIQFAVSSIRATVIQFINPTKKPEVAAEFKKHSDMSE